MHTKILIISLLISLPTVGQQAELHLNLGHTSAITSLTFSADGQYLISSSNSGPFKFWSVSRGKLLATAPPGVSSAFRSFYLLEDDNTVIFSEGLREVIFGTRGAPRFWVWDIKSGGIQMIDARSQAMAAPIIVGGDNLGEYGKQLKKFLDARQGTNLDFSGFTPDGKFYFEQIENQLKFFRLFEKNPRFSAMYEGLGSTYAFSSNGKYIFNTRSGFDGPQENSYIWEVTSGQRLSTAPIPDGIFLSDITNDGQWALTVDLDGQFGLFNLKTGEITRDYNSNDGFNPNNIPVHAAAISPNGRIIARGEPDGAIVIHELRSGRVQMILKGFSHQMNALDVPDNNASIQIRDDKYRWWEWNLSTGLVQVHEEVISDEPKYPDLNLIGITDDQTMGIVSIKEKGLIMYDLKEGKEVKVLSNNPRFERAVFTPDHKKAFLISSPEPGGGKPVFGDNLFWDLEKRDTIFALRHFQSTQGVAISPDGNYLLMGGYDGDIYQYGLPGGELIHRYPAFNSPIVDLKFSNDGKKFITISRDIDGKAIIWDLATHSKIATLYILGEEDWVVINEDNLFDASPNALYILFYKVTFNEEVEMVDLEQ